MDKQDFSAREADAISVETSGDDHAERGDTRRPIRKRGYHRALKRKEPWAVHHNSFREQLALFNAQIIEANRIAFNDFYGIPNALTEKV